MPRARKSVLVADTANAPQIRICEHPSCALAGDFRAPKARDRLSEYRWFCLEHVRGLVEDARRRGNFVRIDMEDSSTTSDTLAIYRELRNTHDNVGVVLQAYLRYQVGAAMAPYLSKAWRDVDFDFRGRVLRGETTPPSRRQLVLDAINQAGGPILASEYVARYLPLATRARAEAVADAVRAAMSRALDGNAWMSADAKAEARAKLAKLKIEVGVDDNIEDKVVAAIGSAGKTGQIGDGKIFVHDLDRAVRIRTGETDNDAL